jgi:hypothetical protein
VHLLFNAFSLGILWMRLAMGDLAPSMP